jgi:hypothetical protein
MDRPPRAADLAPVLVLSLLLKEALALSQIAGNATRLDRSSLMVDAEPI